MMTIGFKGGWLDSNPLEYSQGPSQLSQFARMPSQPLFKMPSYEIKVLPPKVKFGFDFEFNKEIYKKSKLDIEFSYEGGCLKITSIIETLEKYSLKKKWEAEIV